MGEVKKVCALSGAEIKGKAFTKVEIQIDNDTKVQAIVFKRTGSNTFLQGAISEDSLNKIGGLLQPLAKAGK